MSGRTRDDHERVSARDDGRPARLTYLLLGICMPFAIRKGFFLLTASVASLVVVGPGPARADNILYETFGSNGIVSFDATTGAALANLGATASAIAAGNGMVFFGNGNAIDETSSSLVGLTTFHVNNAPVIGLALDASTGILYETDGGNDITAFNAATGRSSTSSARRPRPSPPATGGSSSPTAIRSRRRRRAWWG